MVILQNYKSICCIFNLFTKKRTKYFAYVVYFLYLCTRFCENKQINK